MASPVQNGDLKWEVDTTGTASQASASNFDTCVDKTAESSRPALKAAANAFVEQSGGGGFSRQVDDSVDSSVDATSRAAKDSCVII